jgi:glycerate kinase
MRRISSFLSHMTELSVKLSRVAESASNSGGGLCLISAGETTVQLADKAGKGGRNQELALSAGITLHQMSYGNAELNSFDVTILSIGTDGQDGPTDAAGALADVDLIRKSGFTLERGQQYLDENDSYNFFHNAADGTYHIKTGQTGTNVMDLQLIMIRPKGMSPVRGSDWARKEFDEAFE